MNANVIDIPTFETLKEMTGADFLPVLMDAFFEDSAGLFVELRESLLAGDTQRFSRAAHSMKGNSANFGAGHLSEMGRELEMIGKSGHLDGAEPKLAALKEEFDRVRKTLEDLRDGI